MNKPVEVTNFNAIMNSNSDKKGEGPILLEKVILAVDNSHAQ